MVSLPLSIEAFRTAVLSRLPRRTAAGPSFAVLLGAKKRRAPWVCQYQGDTTPSSYLQLGATRVVLAHVGTQRCLGWGRLEASMEDAKKLGVGPIEPLTDRESRAADEARFAEGWEQTQQSQLSALCLETRRIRQATRVFTKLTCKGIVLCCIVHVQCPGENGRATPSGMGRGGTRLGKVNRASNSLGCPADVGREKTSATRTAWVSALEGKPRQHVPPPRVLSELVTTELKIAGTKAPATHSMTKLFQILRTEYRLTMHRFWGLGEKQLVA